jgi:hypothetical protein
MEELVNKIDDRIKSQNGLDKLEIIKVMMHLYVPPVSLTSDLDI